MPCTQKETINNAIDHLYTLKAMYEDEVVPTMIYDGDHEDMLEDIKDTIKELKKVAQ